MCLILLLICTLQLSSANIHGGQCSPNREHLMPRVSRKCIGLHNLEWRFSHANAAVVLQFIEAVVRADVIRFQVCSPPPIQLTCLLPHYTPSVSAAAFASPNHEASLHDQDNNVLIFVQESRCGPRHSCLGCSLHGSVSTKRYRGSCLVFVGITSLCMHSFTAPSTPVAWLGPK